MRLTLSARNASAIIANIRAQDAIYQRDVRKAVFENGEFCRELTAFFTPVDTGFMQANVETLYSEEGLSFETGWSSERFAEAGHPPYFIFVVKGTSRMPARDPLSPAFEETSRHLLDDLRQLLKASRRRAA